MTIWYIFCSVGTFFPALVSCTKKNLATLIETVDRDLLVLQTVGRDLLVLQTCLARSVQTHFIENRLVISVHRKSSFWQYFFSTSLCTLNDSW
jgi:hypothetical protein